MKQDTVKEPLNPMDDSHNNEMEISRRSIFQKGGVALASTCAVMVTMGSPDVALADKYDDEAAERRRKAKEDQAKQKELFPLILFGGTALSVPFFLPNLIRLFKKTVTLGEDDGY